ncbi:UNVERIFIED_ORG: hypothetical protein M2402_001373 [Rahnella aquatilis]|jgi:hypothetical protein
MKLPKKIYFMHHAMNLSEMNFCQITKIVFIDMHQGI